MLARLRDIIAYQAMRFFNPHESYCLAWLVGGLAFAAAVMLLRRRSHPWRLRHLLGGRKLWLHPSTLLDAKLYLLHGVLILIAYGTFEGTSQSWAAGARALLTQLHAPAATGAPHWLAGSITTLGQVLLLELGYWTMHFAFHRIPALWELHKVHHSAQVMTPLTEWRQHPIEFIAFGNVAGFATGAVYGAASWAFGAGAEPFTLFQVNLLLVAHFATFHHLRHSGVWIAARGLWGRLVHSPAHHQLHHSSDPRHFDCNLGYALSLWDWAFGTLVMPERAGRVTLGVAGEPAYRGVADVLLRPLAAGARTLRRN